MDVCVKMPYGYDLGDLLDLLKKDGHVLAVETRPPRQDTLWRVLLFVVARSCCRGLAANRQEGRACSAMALPFRRNSAHGPAGSARSRKKHEEG